MSKRCCAESCFNSQQINKNVSYFGFPKYETFAVQWAIAANRSDLLDKKLSCITKYYLCGEHFTDDCFYDPPLNTRLKKTLNPVNIPLPSIFKCNIHKYIPNLEAISDSNYTEQEVDDDDDDEQKKHFDITSDVSALGKTREGISMESLSVFHDHYNYTDISSCASFLNNVPDIPQVVDVDDMHSGINNLSKDNSFDDIVHCDTFPDVIEETNSIHICRLCANTFTSAENLYDLTSETYDKINDILSDYIYNNDDLPRIACANCIDRLNKCLNTLDFFRKAQIQLKKYFQTH